MEADQSEKTLSPENSINTTKHPLQNRFVHVPKGYVSIFFFPILTMTHSCTTILI